MKKFDRIPIELTDESSMHDPFFAIRWESTVKIPRMETIKRTAEIFGLPVHFVRQKVLSGEIVAVRAGKRFLVNIDRFADYLNCNTVVETAPRRSDEENAPRVSPISLR